VAWRHGLAALLMGLSLAASDVRGQPAANAGAPPRGLGQFEDWTAATHTVSLETKCYASTRALSSSPKLPGRGPAVLWVTWLQGGLTSVMIDAGLAVPDATVTVETRQTTLPFYTITRQAFPRNTEATLAALNAATEPLIVAHFPGPNGIVLTDTFSLNGFAAAYAAIRDACQPAPARSTAAVVETEKPSGGMREIPLRMAHGVLVVPVVINDSITLPFMVDSGAAGVTIPADIAETLQQNGALWPNDYHGKRTFSMANGSTSEAVMIHIKSLQVGDRRVENIAGIVTPAKSPLLLGQSFLSRFRTWSIDNERKVLVLE